MVWCDRNNDVGMSFRTSFCHSQETKVRKIRRGSHNEIDQKQKKKKKTKSIFEIPVKQLSDVSLNYPKLTLT